MSRYHDHLIGAQQDEQDSHLHHQAELEAQEQEQRRYPVLCWVCHRIMRYSQWPGMRSRHPECK